MTGLINSTLALNADVVLNISVEREACSNNLAPTSSTTATLVMGDALAVALTKAKNFKPEDFARFHPGGRLGRKLLTRVSQVMYEKNLPICSPETSIRDVVSIINRGRLGIAIVMLNKKLLGVISDGDIRRTFDLEEYKKDIKAFSIMNDSPKQLIQICFSQKLKI